MALSETARLIASLELKDLFTKTLGNAEKSLNSFDKKIDGSQSRAYRAGTQIGTGIKRGAAIAVGATAGFAVLFEKAIGKASDLNESVSKTEVVFGKSAASVLAFGKTASNSLGLSEQAADEASATFGNLFLAIGLGQPKAATMSTTLVKLAADLASFNNVSPDEALLALRSGLVGETEPLRKFGVNLNDQTLKAEAVRLGLVKLTKGHDTYTKVLTANQKAQAAYSLILQQTKTAQGDVARTAGGVANQTRFLKANWDDLLATLAKPSLPGISKVLQRVNSELKANQPQVAKFGEAIAGLFSDENIDKGFKFIKTGVDTLVAAAPILERTAEATLGFVKAGVGIFNGLPDPLKALVVGGFALNKLTGGLVTNVAGGIADLVGKSRGSSAANPVWVKSAGGAAGLPGVDPTGGGGKLGALGKIALIGDLVASGLAVYTTWKEQIDTSSDIGKQVSDNATKFISGGASLKDLQTALDATNAGINEIQSNPLNVLVAGSSLDDLKKQAQALAAAIAAQERIDRAKPGLANPILDRGGRELGAVAGKMKDDLNAVADIARGVNALTVGALRAVERATKPQDVAKAVKEAMDRFVTKGKGGVDATKELIGALKKQLAHTDDPKLQATIRTALKAVEKKLPGREYAVASLNKADGILRSNKTSAQKIDALKAIEKDLKERSLPHAADRIREKEEAVRKAAATAGTKTANAATAAGNKTAQAINDKDWQFYFKIPVTVSLASLQEADAKATRIHARTP